MMVQTLQFHQNLLLSLRVSLPESFQLFWTRYTFSSLFNILGTTFFPFPFFISISSISTKSDAFSKKSEFLFSRASLMMSPAVPDLFTWKMVWATVGLTLKMQMRHLSSGDS